MTAAASNPRFPEWRRGSVGRRVLEGAYVAAVVVTAAIAFADPIHPVPWAFAASFVLCLPALVVFIPIYYVVVAIAWNVSGADHGGPSIVVTAASVGVLVGAAVANVALYRLRHPLAWFLGRPVAPSR